MRRNQQKEERIFFVLRALEITISLKKGTETARLIPFAGSLECVPFAFDIDDFAILDHAAEYRKKELVLEVLGAVGTVVFASRNTDSVIMVEDKPFRYSLLLLGKKVCKDFAESLLVLLVERRKLFIGKSIDSLADVLAFKADKPVIFRLKREKLVADIRERFWRNFSRNIHRMDVQMLVLLVDIRSREGADAGIVSAPSIFGTEDGKKATEDFFAGFLWGIAPSRAPFVRGHDMDMRHEKVRSRKRRFDEGCNLVVHGSIPPYMAVTQG